MPLDNDMKKYFAYGSNMLTERLKARVSSASNPTLFVLRGYRLRFHKKSRDCSGKCSIVKTASETDVVYGVLFDLADDQEVDLDRAEGRDQGYFRDEIQLSSEDSSARAFVYIAEAEAIDDALVPYRWYYDLVMAGAEQHDLPKDYIAGLRAIPFTEDPKPDRKSKREALEALELYAQSKISL